MDFTGLSTTQMQNKFAVRGTPQLDILASSGRCRIYQSGAVVTNELGMAILGQPIPPQKRIQMFIEDFRISMAGSDIIGIGFMAWYKYGILLAGLNFDASNVDERISYHRVGIDSTVTEMSVGGAETYTSGDDLYIEVDFLPPKEAESDAQNYMLRGLGKLNGDRVGSVFYHDSPGPRIPVVLPAVWMKNGGVNPASYIEFFDWELYANKQELRQL